MNFIRFQHRVKVTSLMMIFISKVWILMIFIWLFMLIFKCLNVCLCLHRTADQSDGADEGGDCGSNTTQA